MRRNRVAAVAAVAALGASALVSGASPAGATAGGEQIKRSCYDTASHFSKSAGSRMYPEYGVYLRTTTACKDINIKLTDVGRYVQVCFPKTHSCNKLKFAHANKWTTVATNVKDYAEYYFQFDVGFARTGYIAD
ncbi:hypothetical protein ACMA1D_18115 [Streptomyces sp. 796.1]|uniref:hypothetical protein n=1 Tax=Streptomyces sp. 796.1 TaxID=3163029 RepID=UPI0039C8F786